MTADVEGWALVSRRSGERIGWFGHSTRADAERWFERESKMPYRPPFFMVGLTSGAVIEGDS